MSAREGDFPALSWMRRAGAEDELLVEVARQVRRRQRRRLAFLSSALAVLLIVGAVWRPGLRTNHEQAFPAAGTTVVSAPERQVLPDGSVVELKDGAQIEVDYRGPFRRIGLRQGEAHFEVVKDARPFVVEAAGVTVGAVGTAFSVQLGAEQIEVVVTEGRVRIAPTSRLAAERDSGGTAPAIAGAPVSPSAGNAAPTLGAGYRAIIDRAESAPRIEAMSEAEVADRLAWRIPHLEFSRTPLSEVIALMNRHAGHHPVRFVIADSELNAVRLSGFLRADNRDGLVSLLKNNFGITAERTADTLTLRRTR